MEKAVDAAALTRVPALAGPGEQRATVEEPPLIRPCLSNFPPHGPARAAAAHHIACRRRRHRVCAGIATFRHWQLLHF